MFLLLYALGALLTLLGRGVWWHPEGNRNTGVLLWPLTVFGTLLGIALS